MPLDALQIMQGYRARDLANMGAQQRMDMVPQEFALKREAIEQAAQRQKALADLQTATLINNVQKGRQLAAYQTATLASRDADRKSRETIAGDKQQAKADAPPKLDDESARNLAVESLYDPNATVGFRRDPTTMGQIMKHRTGIMKDSGITPEDVVSGRAGFKADTLSLNKMVPQYDAVRAFSQNAIRNGQLLKELANKVDTTGVPVAERWIRAGRKATGDADVAALDAQMRVWKTEAAKIISNPNLSGVLTVEAQKDMDAVVGNYASAPQITRVVDLFTRDFGNRESTLENQIGAARKRMSKRASPNEALQSIAPPIAPPTASPVAPPAAAPASIPPAAQRTAGQVYDTPKGKLKWTGTGWVPP